MSETAIRRVAIAGIALLLGGIASLGIGLFDLDATVETAYFNRSTRAEPVDAVYTTWIDGKAWLIAGTGLVVTGGVALAAAALKR